MLLLPLQIKRWRSALVKLRLLWLLRRGCRRRLAQNGEALWLVVIWQCQWKGLVAKAGALQDVPV
jgi:hypothetical protein